MTLFDEYYLLKKCEGNKLFFEFLLYGICLRNITYNEAFFAITRNRNNSTEQLLQQPQVIVDPMGDNKKLKIRSELQKYTGVSLGIFS